jgi:hypothetical protein
LQIEEAVRRELVSKMDARLAKRAEMERDLEDALPEAMQVLLDHVREKRDLRAALEVFDRDPAHQFVKASRTASENQTPAISSEALATAVKEAEWTHKIMQNPPTPAEACFVNPYGQRSQLSPMAT